MNQLIKIKKNVLTSRANLIPATSLLPIYMYGVYSTLLIKNSQPGYRPKKLLLANY